MFIVDAYLKSFKNFLKFQFTGWSRNATKDVLTVLSRNSARCSSRRSAARRFGQLAVAAPRARPGRVRLHNAVLRQDRERAQHEGVGVVPIYLRAVVASCNCANRTLEPEQCNVQAVLLGTLVLCRTTPAAAARSMERRSLKLFDCLPRQL